MTDIANRTSLLGIRLTPDERAQVECDRGDMSLSDYGRHRLLGADSPPPRHRNKSPVRDHKLIAKILGELGKARYASNLNQIARAHNSGSLPLDPETSGILREACSAIVQMRDMLLRALGISTGDRR